MLIDVDAATMEHIITLLEYAHEKNQVARHRNAVRKRKVRDQQAYIEAGLMVKEVTAKWKYQVNAARKALDYKYRLMADASAGYCSLNIHSARWRGNSLCVISNDRVVGREDFEKVINMYKANKAIEDLLKE
jgi:hypothetical protein